MLYYNNPITSHSAEMAYNFHTCDSQEMLFAQFGSECLVKFCYGALGQIYVKFLSF